MPSKRMPPPYCGCGCGQRVRLNKKTKRYNKYIVQSSKRPVPPEVQRLGSDTPRRRSDPLSVVLQERAWLTLPEAALLFAAWRRGFVRIPLPATVLDCGYKSSFTPGNGYEHLHSRLFCYYKYALPQTFAPLGLLRWNLNSTERVAHIQGRRPA